MYSIANVIYGIPISGDISRILDDQEENGSEDEFWLDDHFETLYSGSASRHVGYCGILLAEFDECEDPGTKLSDINKQPTEEQKEKVQKMIDSLPQPIKDVMPEVDTWIVWSTS